MGTRGAWYSPAESETTLRTNPRSGLETVTWTPGITAPDESVTVPTILARSCALTANDARPINTPAIPTSVLTIAPFLSSKDSTPKYVIRETVLHYLFVVKMF